jgi:hypothetical protein
VINDSSRFRACSRWTTGSRLPLILAAAGLSILGALPASAAAVFQINSGGAAAAPFAADKLFSGGKTSTTTATINTSGVTNPAPQAVYKSERWGGDANDNPAPFSYTFTGLTAGASFTVRLHFAEIFFTATGQRAFNVAINGTRVLTNFDIVAAAGGANKAIVKEFTTTATSSGTIAVNYTVGTADAPKSSGIEIVSASSTPDFSLSASPASQTVTAGGSTSYSAGVAAVNGFSGNVVLSVSGLPAGATASFSPSTVAGSGSSTLNVSTSASTPAATSTLTITGTSGGTSHTTSVNLVVNGAATPNFTLSATPASRTVTAGGSTTYTASVSPQNGFGSSVSLSVSGLPAGATASFSPSSITGGSGSSTLNVSTSASTPAATSTLTINGSGGGISHSATVSLTVNSAGGGGGTTLNNVYITLYGFPDNSPPGKAISYPKSGGFPTIHNQATAGGSASNPSTFASDAKDGEFRIGQIVYVPFLQKYFINEDECTGSGPPIAGTGNCEADWQRNRQFHIDLWLDGSPPGRTQSVLDCEDALTRKDTIIVDPPNNLTVDPRPLFDSSTNTCWPNTH